ncbi:MAG: RIP metalloprotease RseP [Pseudomonadota bacterium]
MLQAIGIFFLFLTPLIFFHELGHFLFARLFGVRVDVFSIGFGPKLFKWKKNYTEYAWSLIPLGGYVKMFGDDPLNKDGIPPEERKYSFSHQGKWARFWIVFGGPLANFILAYVIFFLLILSGEKIPEMRFGVIPEKAVFYERGLRSGDVLKKVNDQEVWGPTDLLFDEKTKIQNITVERHKELKEINLNITSKEFFEGFLNFIPLFRIPVLIDKKGTRFALSNTADKVDWSSSLDTIDNWANNGVFYLHPIDPTENLENNGNPKVVSDPKLIKKLTLKFNSPSSFFTELVKNSYWPADLVVRSVNMQSPADKAGIKAGDILTALQGKSVTSFEDLRNNLQEFPDKQEVTIEYYRQGELHKIKVLPEIKKQDNKSIKLIGIYSSGVYLPQTFVIIKPKSFSTAMVKGFTRTWITVAKTVEGLKKLITAEISVKNIGGPFTIGKVASDSFHIGLSHFFQIMALISINLAVINLFPIPILDGGHILFIIVEIFNRGPVSRRKMEIAQQIGLSVLLLLMLGALFNDFTRFF